MTWNVTYHVYLCVLETLSNNERSMFLDYAELIITKCVDTVRMKLTKQFKTISPAPTKFLSNPERYVHNLSPLCLDKTLLEVLSLGPKFCCPSSNVTQLDLEVQFKNLFDQLSGLVPSSELDLEQLENNIGKLFLSVTSIIERDSVNLSQKNTKKRLGIFAIINKY